MTPRLSIITPCKNYGTFLPQCLASVVAQGRGDVEHIVIDAASTDQTLEVLRAWEGPGRSWVSESDRNQSHALNKGLARAQGEWVCWLNADEFYLPGALDAAMSQMSSHVRIVTGDYAEVNEHGELVRLLPQHAFSRRVLGWFGPYMPSCGTFFRRASVPSSGFDESLRYVMDWDLWLRLAHSPEQVVYVPRVMAAFALHGRSLTGTGLPPMHEELQAVRLRYGLPAGRRTMPHWWLARAERLLRKTLNGSHLRVQRSRALHGKDLRWGEGNVASPAASRLVLV